MTIEVYIELGDQEIAVVAEGKYIVEYDGPTDGPMLKREFVDYEFVEAYNIENYEPVELTDEIIYLAEQKEDDIQERFRDQYYDYDC